MLVTSVHAQLTSNDSPSCAMAQQAVSPQAFVLPCCVLTRYQLPPSVSSLASTPMLPADWYVF